MSDFPLNRRRFLLSAAASAAAISLAHSVPAIAASPSTSSIQTFAKSPLNEPMTRFPIKQISTDLLDVGYYEAGPEEGRPVILLHGFPYDIHSFVSVAALLAAQGHRVIVPHLRGHGSTVFLNKDTLRSGQQGALGQDVLDLMNALHIPEAVLAGFGWGADAAVVAAALKPTRVVGLVSANSDLAQNISTANAPLPAAEEHALWYQYYFQTERGRAGLAANRRDIARILWQHNSPDWQFDEAAFERAADTFDNSDYVDVVIHHYRHRLGLAAGAPEYDEVEKKLAQIPLSTAAGITLDGAMDGQIGGRSLAVQCSGERHHRQISRVSQNLPQEAPQVFADACAEWVRYGKWRT